jgi:hypothetical protein
MQKTKTIQNVSFGFTNIDVDGEERPQYVICMEIYAVESMKPNKLKRHLDTSQTECATKTPEIFRGKLN